ncbi:MAG: trigger factor, partial [Sphingomonas sp.]
FDGGTGTDMSVEIGSGRLIPGFEDQVIGVKTGDEKQISVTFPEDYQEKSLAGKPATFDLSITAVKTAGESKIDDELAKSLGLTDLEQLKGLLKGQIEQEHNGLTRTYMKRKLLDQLAEGHDFPVPPSMVEAEFNQIWQQLEHEATHEPDPEAALKEMEAERDDYRAIAERRVRLGLLLSEIGQANGVEVSQQEMNRLIAQAAQQYGPDDRQRFIQYVQQDPMAAAQLRAPLYEDKVVDWLFDKAQISEREVTREELEAAIESEEGFSTGTHHHDHDNHKPKAAKKATAKKASAKNAPETKSAAKPKKLEKADIEPAAPGDDLVKAEPVKKAAVKKAPAPKVEEAPAKKPAAKKAPAKKG